MRRVFALLCRLPTSIAYPRQRLEGGHQSQSLFWAWRSPHCHHLAVTSSDSSSLLYGIRSDPRRALQTLSLARYVGKTFPASVPAVFTAARALSQAVRSRPSELRAEYGRSKRFRSRVSGAMKAVDEAAEAVEAVQRAAMEVRVERPGSRPRRGSCYPGRPPPRGDACTRCAERSSE